MKQNKNYTVYDRLWKHIDVIEYNFGSSWEIIRQFQNKKMLEIGPGNFPRIPIREGYFVDTSKVALEHLCSRGAQTFHEQGNQVLTSFPAEFFDLVVAFDVLEHIKDDVKTLQEVQRILKKGGYFFLAVPIRMKYLSHYDFRSEHQRRYEPEELIKKLSGAGFKIIKWRGGGILSWLYSFSLIRLCQAYFNPFLSITILPYLPRFIVRAAIKSANLCEKRTRKGWQTNSINIGKRITRLEIFCKK